jgi:hypothetical protein
VVAFPPPPVTLRQRSSTFAEPLRPLRRVLSKGFHSFLSEWFEKVSQPSLAEPFGSDSGVIELTVRLFLLSLGRRHPIAVPLSVSMAVTVVTGCLYASPCFRSNFCVFYFGESTKVFRLFDSFRKTSLLHQRVSAFTISSRAASISS